MITLRFLAVESADAFSPPHVRVGRVTPIGKTRNADGSLTLDTAPTTIVLNDAHVTADVGFLRRQVLDGDLKPFDSATARLLDVPFDAEKKKADTLPPPAQKEVK